MTKEDESLPRYTKSNPEEYWFCELHNRRATHILHRKDMAPHHCCIPDLGGILVPCKCIRLFPR